MRTSGKVLLCALLMTAACSSRPANEAASVPSIDGDAIKSHIQKLSSDEMEGRGPGGKGEQLATSYIADFYRSLGLKTQFQDVPMIGIAADVSPMKLTGKGGTRTLKFKDEFMGWSRHEQDTLSIDADLVFCGYGVIAPEYQWNDFKDDVKGKIIVVFINDPQVEDPTKFGGKAMTYYGRWTYKYEEAARQGAAGVLIVHETPYAGYPWEVVRNSWSGEQFDIVRPDKGASAVPLQGWITRDVAVGLFKSAGLDFEGMKKKSLDPNFRPVPLGIHASVELKNQLRPSTSKNVIGVLEGSESPDEYALFTAHWDHLGVGEPENGDAIYNGAVDNASGVAMLLEMAHTATRIQPRPKRSMVFIAVTAEEQGLLGSAYYAENPVFPLNKTLANLNIDGINVYGRDDGQVQVIGYGRTTMEDVLKEVLVKQGRTVIPDREPEKGSYFRSDQFNFAKKGVPALYMKSTTPKDADDYTANRYHKPSDQYDPNWDMKAAVADGNAMLEVALRVANGQFRPEWKPGTEFARK